MSCVGRVIEFRRRPVDLLPTLFGATLLWVINDQRALTERVFDTTPRNFDSTSVMAADRNKCASLGKGKGLATLHRPLLEGQPPDDKCGDLFDHLLGRQVILQRPTAQGDHDGQERQHIRGQVRMR